ncbi:MAG: putative rane protein [Herbinix sp.]|jgi:ABC-2 type transport system permease protein|nr:putative rane protein [Herbinix sp.]
MINLLQSDFYRLFKSKAFYICTAVAAFLVSLSIFILDWSLSVASNINTTETVNMTFPYKDGISYGINAFSSGDVHLFIAIFTAIFITAEFAHGTMKNVVSKGFSKVQIYLSKVITMTAASFIMIFTMFIIGTISATIVTGVFSESSGTLIAQMFQIAGIELFLHTALTAVFVMIAMTVRNSGGVIAINIVGVMSLSSLIYVALSYLFHNKINFSDYSLMYNIQLFNNMNLTVTGLDYLRSILVGAAFLAAFTIGGIFLFKKSDVK